MIRFAAALAFLLPAVPAQAQTVASLLNDAGDYAAKASKENEEAAFFFRNGRDSTGCVHLSASYTASLRAIEALKQARGLARDRETIARIDGYLRSMQTGLNAIEEAAARACPDGLEDFDAYQGGDYDG
jgi:hypothetical protein